MANVITQAANITGDWLQSVFRDACVERFAVEVDQSNTAGIARITVEFADGYAPRRLFLKMRAGSGDFIADSECRYYTRDYVDVLDAPLPRCYAAAFDEASGAYHLLLEDVSETHHDNKHIQPTRDYGVAVAQAMAALHARWWDRVPLPTPAQIERYVAASRAGLEPMIDVIRELPEGRWIEPLRELFAHHPAAMVRRMSNPRGLTLIHGDCNPTNILSPKAGVGNVYLIDRQPFVWSLTTWLGVSDVAYMMVHWWDTALRREYERDVVRAYHAALVGRGARDYSFDEAWGDYRLCAVQSAYVPALWCANDNDRDRMQWLWLMQLRRTMTTIEDLKCAELWSIEA